MARAEWQRRYRMTPKGKEANAAAARRHRAKIGDDAAAEWQRRYRATPEGKAASRQYWARLAVKKRDADNNRRAKYGLDPETYEAMVLAQGGLCLICHDRSAEHVDHDHATGKVRGLLCGPCNRGIGSLRDNAGLCRAAAAYLDAA